jgi:hypothetical protein
MAFLFGKKYTKEELMKYVGDVSQVADARYSEIRSGRGKGVSTIDVNNGSGLGFSIIPDRGMDIAWANFKGVPLAHISKTGLSSPAFFEEEGAKFFRNFTAGLLTTCGLTYMGAPSFDNGQELGAHGRISNIPADDISIYREWEEDEFIIKIRGKVRESVFYAENITLTRNIKVKMGENRIIINDIIENCGFDQQPFMLLYHFNFGHPLVSPESKLYHTRARVSARDNIALQGIDSYDAFHQPLHQYKEQVFFYNMEPENDTVFACIYNENLNGGLGVNLKYKKSQLQHFAQWKQMGEGDYVTALEPCTYPPLGRAVARSKGELEFIQAGEKRHFDLEIGIIDGSQELSELLL